MAKKVMVAMSGGVDSSVSLYLLKEKGYELCGATMKLFANEDIGLDHKRTCCSLEDVEDARRVAYQFGIQHYVFNFGKQFHQQVIEPFTQSYVQGETPNPCILCNRTIKFKELIQRAELMGYEAIATGHYARVEYDADKGRYLLKKGLDEGKDQSYVLYTMTQEELAKTLFPLGNLRKQEVRKIAEDNALVNYKKPDSQDICFIPDGDYGKFLKDVMQVTPKEGDFVNQKGEALGRHKGVIHYTIGQRKGLGVSFGKPMYVTHKNAETATVTLGDHEDLFTGAFYARDVNFISIPALSQPMEVTIKTRYKQKEAEAILYPRDGGVWIECRQKQRAVTPGQAVVFYQGDIVVGGGTIDQTRVCSH